MPVKVINGHKFDPKMKLVINFAYGVSRVCLISANSPFPSQSDPVINLTMSQEYTPLTHCKSQRVQTGSRTDDRNGLGRV